MLFRSPVAGLLWAVPSTALDECVAIQLSFRRDGTTGHNRCQWNRGGLRLVVGDEGQDVIVVQALAAAQVG